MCENLFSNFKRIVIKIGTRVLTLENNRLDTSIIEHIVEQVCYLIEEEKKEVIIVTSGAIAAGMQILGWNRRPYQINKLQAAASVGQSKLMRVYERLFKEEGLNVGQILLTRDIFLIPERKKMARETLLTLLKFGVIPIINENDSVAIEEIKFGDNDILAAFVTELVNADLLLIVTDVDGLYKHDPKKKVKNNVIHKVKNVKKIEKMATSGEPGKKGTGGMKSKIEAAKFVTEKGKYCLIINGKKMWSIKRVFKGKKIGTIFYPIGG